LLSLVPRLSQNPNEKSNYKQQKAGWGLGMMLTLAPSHKRFNRPMNKPLAQQVSQLR